MVELVSSVNEEDLIMDTDAEEKGATLERLSVIMMEASSVLTIHQILVRFGHLNSTVVSIRCLSHLKVRRQLERPQLSITIYFTRTRQLRKKPIRRQIL